MLETLEMIIQWLTILSATFLLTIFLNIGLTKRFAQWDQMKYKHYWKKLLKASIANSTIICYIFLIGIIFYLHLEIGKQLYEQTTTETFMPLAFLTAVFAFIILNMYLILFPNLIKLMWRFSKDL